MKYIFVLACILVFSCKKEKGENHRFVGTYELMEAFSVESIVPYQFFPPGNGRIMKILEDGSLETWRHDTLVKKEPYSLVYKTDCHSRTQEVFIQRTSSPGDYVIGFKSDTLFLRNSNCYQDGGISFFRRIR
jgi:hypothetical protein